MRAAMYAAKHGATHRSKLAGTALAVTSEKLAAAAPTKQASNQQPPALHLVTLVSASLFPFGHLSNRQSAAISPF